MKFLLIALLLHLYLYTFSQTKNVQLIHTVTKPALFPGCDNLNCSSNELIKYLYSNFKYSPQMGCVKGTIVARFTITEEGIIENAEIVRDLGGRTGDELLRVINSMNDFPKKWTPAKLGEQKVSIKYTVPFRFEIR